MRNSRKTEHVGRRLFAALTFILLLAAFISLSLCDNQLTEDMEINEEPAAIGTVPEKVSKNLLSMNAPPKLEEQKTEAIVHPDPYADWRNWCEPVYYKPCETKADCKGIEHPAGWDLKCVKRWTDGAKVCAPGYDGSGKWRNWRKERLREIIRQQYFDEAELCDPDVPIVEQDWRCQREAQKGNKLHDFMWLVYYRETTGRPWKRHRLNPDARANKTAWGRPRYSKRYGWEAEFDKHGEVLGFKRTAKDPNEHYRFEERWQYGLGPYGQIAASWTFVWDPHAPPEILCREVESTEAYLRAARRSWRKIKGGVDCDGDGDREYQAEPTLGLVHRGASGGKICPPKGGKVQYKPGFLRRMKAMGLDPDKPVPLSFFGKPIPKEGQNERAQEIHSVLDDRHPKP